MKEYNLKITAGYIPVTHLLGGLAQSYRQLPASAPGDVAFELKYMIINILEQLQEQGADVLKPRSPFASYARLVGFEKHLELFK
jgi:hypothetical protein